MKISKVIFNGEDSIFLFSKRRLIHAEFLGRFNQPELKEFGCDPIINIYKDSEYTYKMIIKTDFSISSNIGIEVISISTFIRVLSIYTLRKDWKCHEEVLMEYLL